MSTDFADILHASESVLVADIGHTTTTVCLFDVVEDSYRFLARAQAPTSTSAPWLNVMFGLQQAIAQLEKTTLRVLLDKEGRLLIPSSSDGSGVDHFAASVSAADPLNVMTVGLLDEVSLASARRALSAVYSREVDSFSISDTRSVQEQVAAIVEKKPDLIFIAGGTDGGDSRRVLDMVETVALGIELLGREDIHRPQVIYAGNRQLREAVKGLLATKTTLHAVQNVRPDLETEHLDEAAELVAQLYEDIKISRIPGIEEVRAWTAIPLMPTAQAFAGISQYFAATSRGRVYGLDIGSNSVSLVSALPSQVRLAVRTDLGAGKLVKNLLDLAPASQITRWLPTDNEAAFDAAGFLHSKAMNPQSVPATEPALRMEQAIARELITHTVNTTVEGWDWTPGELPPCKLILLRGSSFTYAPRAGQTMLMLLDALQPSGIFAVAVDQYGVLPAMGIMSKFRPLIAVQALESGVLVDLGWVVAPMGQGQEGKPAVHLKLESEQIGLLEIDVNFGSLEVLPVAPGQTARLTVNPVSRRFDIGYGPGQGKTFTVTGGAVGVVIDARGRPLKLSTDLETRQTKMQQWLWDVGG